MLTVGSEDWVKVIEIDPRAKRVWLSVRRAEEGGDVSYYEPLYPPEDWPEEPGVREPRRPGPGAGAGGATLDDLP